MVSAWKSLKLFGGIAVPGNTGPDNRRDIVIVLRAPEFIVGEIDAGHAVALGAVADGAVCAIQASAVFHIDHGETVLAKQAPARDRQAEQKPRHSWHSIFQMEDLQTGGTETLPGRMAAR